MNGKFYVSNGHLLKASCKAQTEASALMVTHKKYAEKIFKAFATKSALKIHLRIIHNESAWKQTFAIIREVFT